MRVGPPSSEQDRRQRLSAARRHHQQGNSALRDRTCPALAVETDQVFATLGRVPTTRVAVPMARLFFVAA